MGDCSSFGHCPILDSVLKELDKMVQKIFCEL
jgi:chromosome condensin MukBEF MukE localization factor